MLFSFSAKTVKKRVFHQKTRFFRFFSLCFLRFFLVEKLHINLHIILDGKGESAKKYFFEKVDFSEKTHFL